MKIFFFDFFDGKALLYLNVFCCDLKKKHLFRLFKMGYVEPTLSKLSKDDLIRIALDMQINQNYILSDKNNKLSELRKNYNKLEADLKVSKSVTDTMKNQIVVLERKCCSNEQYSSCEIINIYMVFKFRTV